MDHHIIAHQILVLYKLFAEKDKHINFSGLLMQRVERELSRKGYIEYLPGGEQPVLTELGVKIIKRLIKSYGRK